jgi:hypothetical protein
VVFEVSPLNTCVPLPDFEPLHPGAPLVAVHAEGKLAVDQVTVVVSGLTPVFGEALIVTTGGVPLIPTVAVLLCVVPPGPVHWRR